MSGERETAARDFELKEAFDLGADSARKALTAEEATVDGLCDGETTSEFAVPAIVNFAAPVGRAVTAKTGGTALARNECVGPNEAAITSNANSPNPPAK